MTLRRSSGLASHASWIVTLVVLGIIAPLHTRLVFGPPGPERMVAPGAVAA